MADEPLGRIVWRPMYEEVRDRLLRYIEENGLWGHQLISERELAEIFAVSRGTVRKGIAALEREGVVVCQAGRRTRVLPRRRDDERARTAIAVAAFGRESGGSYGARIVRGIASKVADLGFTLSFFDLQKAEPRKRFFEGVADHEVEGAVLLSIIDRATVTRVLDRTSVPVVLADHWFPELPLTAVIDDAEGGARQAVEHLLSLGHRRIGYIEITHRDWNPWRYEGYVGALGDAGIEVDEDLIEPAASFEGALAATNKLLALSDPPTAVFAFDDPRAWGAWTAAETHGLVVGRDFAVVGCGDKGAEGGPMADLSSVSFSAHELGRAAVRELGRLIRGEACPGELVKIPAELKVRRSSAGAHRAPASS